MKNVILATVLALFASGCAVGNKYRFAEVMEDIDVAGQKTVAVASVDKRKTVVAGESPPEYVGVQRGGFGNPFNVTTESDLPFADAVSKSVSSSLEEKGFKTIPVYVKAGTSKDDALRELVSSNAERAILLLIEQWETDTYTNIGLTYDLTLAVYGQNGEILAESSATDSRTIEGDFVNPPAAAREKVPEAFKSAIEELLNDPDVAQALR
jgi:hypothetical protein